MQKAIIIIPTYNERENIQKLVPVIFEVVKKIKNWRVEVLVVDDTSPDKTYEAVLEMQRRPEYKKFLHLVINPKKSGLGGAYMRGMNEAFEKLNADVIFEFDADFSHDPQKIPAFLKKIDEGYDFVIGGRYKDGGAIDPDWPLIRKFYSVVGNLVIMTVLTDFRIRDWTSGYRAITKEVYEKVIKEMDASRFSGYTWQIGFLHKAVRAGFKITEVPIQFIDRKIGESKLGSEYIKNTLFYIFQVRLQEIMEHRLFKFVVVGGVTALLQLILTAILERVFRGIGWSSDFWMGVVQLIGIETSIICNFSLNNLWTFKSHQLKGAGKILPQFLKFNLSAVGSILIQMATLQIGLRLSSDWQWWIVTPTLTYTAIGIMLGMVWNYFAYNKFIWKTKTKDKK